MTVHTRIDHSHQFCEEKKQVMEDFSRVQKPCTESPNKISANPMINESRNVLMAVFICDLGFLNDYLLDLSDHIASL
jgi:hypothetical protein